MRDALRWSHRARRSLVVLALFTVKLGPLGLMAGLEQGVGSGAHDLILAEMLDAIGQTSAGDLRDLPRRHPQRPIQPDDLAVEHAVLDDMAGEVRVLLGPAESLGVGDTGAEFLAGLLG